MKKIILICSISLMLLIIGCQSTPLTDVIAQKDYDNMIMLAKEGNRKSYSSEVLQNIPSNYQLSEEYQALNISVNAKIVLPEENQLEICRIEPSDFTQEVVSDLFSKLCGDLEMYDITTVLTKDNIMYLINNIHEAIDDPNLDAETHQEFIDALTKYEKEYEAAPDSAEIPRNFGQLKYITQYSDEGDEIYHYYGVAAQQFGVADFEVRNNNDLAEAYISDTQKGVSTGGTPVRHGATLRYSSYHSETTAYSILKQIDFDTQSNIGILESGELSMSQIASIVEPLISNYDMVISSVYLCQSEGGDQAVQVFCTRQIGGLSCANIYGKSGGDDLFTPSWLYEELNILLDTKGIIQFEWNSPYELKESILKSVNILPFDDVMPVFSNMIKSKYLPHLKEEKYDSIDVQVGKIQLALQRMVQKDNIDTGLLIPTWNYYGSVIGHRSGKDHLIDEGFSFGRENSLLSINAIDGSVIDISKGY